MITKWWKTIKIHKRCTQTAKLIFYEFKRLDVKIEFLFEKWRTTYLTFPKTNKSLLRLKIKYFYDVVAFIRRITICFLKIKWSRQMMSTCVKCIQKKGIRHSKWILSHQLFLNCMNFCTICIRKFYRNFQFLGTTFNVEVMIW